MWELGGLMTVTAGLLSDITRYPGSPTPSLALLPPPPGTNA